MITSPSPPSLTPLRHLALSRYPNLTLNTSNPIKLAEFQHYLGPTILPSTTDHREPLADATTVIRYKASQYNHTLVDDTSLEIENTNIGVNIKWLLNTLPEHIGKNATFVCLLGIRSGNMVKIFRGAVEGRIVEGRGDAGGFLPYFLPDGASKTLAEERPNVFNARYYAVRDFMLDRTWGKPMEPLETWDGEWQEG